MSEIQNDFTNEENLDATPKRRSRLPLIVGVVVVLLAAAAFVGGRLLNNKNAAGGGPGSLQFAGAGGPGAGQAFALEIMPASELPDAPPDATGLFSRAEDNSVFVQAGNGDFSVSVSDDGTVNMQSSGSGEETEIVITAETKVYREIIEQPSDPSAAQTGGKVQQKVELSTIDQLGQNSFMSAWGQRRGDRLVADVLLFSTPFFIQAPAKGAP